MSQFCPSCPLGTSLVSALSHLKQRQSASCQEPAQMASARVISRRLERQQNHLSRQSLWTFWVTFQLETGETLALQVSEAAYGNLKEGSTVTATWQGDKLLDFSQD